MNGILIGIVELDDNSKGIGIKVGNSDTMIVTIPYALSLFDNLGALLEQLGVFDDEDDGDGDSNNGGEVRH